MRRTALLTAAVVAAATSVTLAGPSANAATAAGVSLTAVASCDQGRATLSTSVDGAGTERGKVTVTGARSRVWRGGLVLDPMAMVAQVGSPGFDASTLAPDERFVAKHGSFGTSKTQHGARSLDATAAFATWGLAACAVTLIRQGGTYLVGGSAFDGMEVQTRTRSVLADVMGEAHHRSRIVLTVRTSTGVKRLTAVRTADSFGFVEAAMRGVPNLSSFREASATITDLRLHSAPETFDLLR